MSNNRSRGGSNADDRPPPRLLAPTNSILSQRRSSANSISIASYYYDNDAIGGSQSSSLPPSPAWAPPTFEITAGTSRSPPLSVTSISGGQSMVHRRTSSGVHRDTSRDSNSISLRDDFSAWASGLQLGSSRDISNDSALQTSAGSNPFYLADDHSPAITLTHFTDARSNIIGAEDIFERYDHHRQVSSATDGDVGQQHYSRIGDDQEGGDSPLPMGMDMALTPADSLLGSPLNGGMRQLDAEDEGDDDDDDVARNGPNSDGYEQYGDTAPMVQSPEETQSIKQGINGSYFARSQKVAFANERSYITDMENGINHPRVGQPSNAESYAGLTRARSGIDRMSKSIRRISRRVVNLDNEHHQDGPSAGHVRLSDVDDDDDDIPALYTTVLEKQAPITPHNLRGRTLGIFGPDHLIRKTLASMLLQVWVEPLILLMIIFNVVLLILQAAPNVFTHPRNPGYFNSWIDYALLAVFCVFTLEIVARVIVSGLFINPPARADSMQKQESSDPIIDQDQSSIPSLGHQRRKASRSNTLDTFVVLGETIKSRANDVLRPSEAYDKSNGNHASGGGVRRTHTSTSTSAYLNSNEFSSQQQAEQRSQKSSIGIITNRLLEKTPFAKAIVAQRLHAVDYAYLRHSYNRIDLVAVVSFWIMFILAITKEEQEPSHHIYIFRALSVLRCARLLTITSGTSTILQSLKTASPLLVNVAFFTLFSMLLFSIIGIQAFKGSYRRTCLWVGDLNPEIPNSAGTNMSLSQFCGGYINMTGHTVGALDQRTGRPTAGEGAKGYICPMGQICLESETNPNNNTESFDNIFDSLLQVIIVISSNGWSTIMYNMIDADYFSSFLYFVIGLLIMNFWMANLFVAVVINTFASITAETKQSAFAAKMVDVREATKRAAAATAAELSASAKRRKKMASVYKRVWGYTKFFWVALIIADLGLQASQANHQRNIDHQRLSNAELYFTIVFDVEILMRFFSYLFDNDWRGFSKRKRNLFDVFLALITTISQVPFIKRSSVYAWLTVFQLARFYRVIIAVPRMEALLVRVFGSLAGLVNMILFLILMVGLATLIAVQLFRGDIPSNQDGQSVEINFKTMFNSYLGMYQIFSSENWTTVLYNVLSTEGQYQQAVIAGIFLCGWFLFANFIVLQMFIAVITENFGVAESQKRAQQLEKYLRKMEKPETSWVVTLVHQLSPYRWLLERNQKILNGNQKSNQDAGQKMGIMAQKAIDALDEKNKKRKSYHHIVSPNRAQKILNVIRKMLRLDRPEEHVPLDTLRARQFRQSFSGNVVLNEQNVHDNLKISAEAARIFARDRQLNRLRNDLGLSRDDPHAQATIDEYHINRHKDDPRIEQAKLINTHPSYEKSLWIFSNTNRFRRSCQSVVPPSYGERIFGRQTSRIRRLVYQGLIFSAIAASVVIAGIATPSYRRDWYGRYGLRRDSWFSLTEVTLGIFFILEFIIKVIADGFAFTPNAYLLSPWNALDLFVLLTLLINISTELAVIGGVSRFTRALKAFRALRLINLSDLMKRAFSSLMAGAGKFFDVSVLAILYIVPFAIWGQNLFSGLLYSCTDTSSAISTKAQCLGEYSANPSQWSFLAPRVWQNPTSGSVYSFDDFKSSLLILFEIVSLEGWTNVMATAMSVTGRNNQLQTDARQINALFFVIYNLIGAIFVLTLFVAVIIENFQEFSGAAYQTTSQRQWIDLKRLIARQRPSKRPKVRPENKFRSWCYDRAVNKHGWWARFITLLYIGSLITLATQQYKDAMWIERLRDIIYVTFTLFFASDILIRLAGLGWIPFRSDLWNIFDLIVVTGTLATTIPLLRFDGPVDSANIQLQKIFLTAVAFKLVQRSNALNQLFKTAVASLPSIASLFLLWLVMFLVWGIMLVEVFGLTAWGLNETYQKNFWTLGGSLVFLSMMSTGEGWNSYMHDFTLSPPFCTPSSNYLETDCGSTGWAYFLFIGWNVISMYIFLNMFTGTVVENFSYVFQLGGAPKLSREQVRNFKQAWSQCDVERSGYMPKEQFVNFFNKLDGVLELRVHPKEASIHALKGALTAHGTCLSRQLSPNSPLKSPLRDRFAARIKKPLGKDLDDKDLNGSFTWPTSPLGSPTEIIIDGMNVSNLNKKLQFLDYNDIRSRKQKFERIYNEAILLSEQPANRIKGGVSFHNMLMLISHYKLIDEAEALSLEELLERREMQEKIDDRIQMERVRGMLTLVWLRRRYLTLRAEQLRLSAEWHQQQQQQHQQGGGGSVPTINIDDAADMTNDNVEASTSFSGRFKKPNLSINTQSAAIVGPSDLLLQTQGSITPPGRSRQLSPSRHGQVPSIHLTTTSEKGDSSREDLHSIHSANPSLKEIEQLGSPYLDQDDSAWVAVSKRISTEVPSQQRKDKQREVEVSSRNEDHRRASLSSLSNIQHSNTSRSNINDTTTWF